MPLGLRKQQSHPALRGRALWSVFLFVSLAPSLGVGCGVKRSVKVPVSQKVLEAKSATLDELLSLISSYDAKLTTLSSSSLKVSFTSGKVESGKLQEYRSAPGYVLLKRPDALRLNIQNPLTKTTIVELASQGDDFFLWYPRENKFFVGRNSVREFDLEGSQNSPVFSARPIHIFEAILPYRLPPEPGMRIAMEEDRDAGAKYYVVSFFDAVGQDRLRPLRRLWFERSALAVVKQVTFAKDGSITSSIRYADLVSVGGLLLPHSIHIERPADGYFLDLQVKSWRVNPDIPETAFMLSPPPAAQRITLKEKTKSP